jgi:NAD(P)-dependent dehydrogenase (short-subunit alcohol dehydrogenase family)
MARILVVGASRGLGLELVRAYLARGDAVTALVREGAGGSALDAHPRQRIVVADVRSESELARAAESLPESERFDALIYNAAIHLERDRRDLEAASTEDMLTTLDVNAVGAARAVRAFRKRVKEHGQIVLISSEAGSIAASKRTSEYGYCMSKAALNMLGKLLANREAELGSGIVVACIHPGWLRTDMGGPHAHLDPTQAARDVVGAIERLGAGTELQYIDWRGNALEF